MLANSYLFFNIQQTWLATISPHWSFWPADAKEFKAFGSFKQTSLYNVSSTYLKANMFRMSTLESGTFRESLFKDIHSGALRVLTW